MTLLAGQVADWLKSRGYPLVWIRKGMTLLGSIFPGVAMISMIFVGCNVTTVIILQLVIQGFLACQMAGGKANLNDIAPQ